jgi:outer membrane protein assembly factor BamB
MQPLNPMFSFVSEKSFARSKFAISIPDWRYAFIAVLSWLIWSSAARETAPAPIDGPLEPLPGFLTAAAFREGYPRVFVNGAFNSEGYYELTNSGPARITIQSSYPEIHFTTNGAPADILSDIYTGEFLIRPRTVINAVAYAVDYTDEVQAEPVTIELVPTYSLTDITFGGGAAAFNPAGGSYLRDTQVNASASNFPGWTFERWEEDGVITSFESNTIVRIDRGKTIRAVFGTELRIAASGGSASGEAIKSPQISFHDYGSTGVVSAIPAFNKFFIRWNLSSSPGVTTFTNNPLSITITNTNALATAIFGPLPAGNRTLTVLRQGLGKVDRSSLLPYYPDGTQVTLTEVAAPGYQFVGWSGDMSSPDESIEVVLDSSKLLTANFSRIPTITITEPAAGAIINGSITNFIRTSASDQDGTVVRVEYYASGRLLGTSDNGSSFSWFANDSGAVDLVAVAIDNAGARGSSLPVRVNLQLPPIFTVQPVSQRVPERPTAVFGFLPEATRVESAQWQHNGTNLPYQVYSYLYFDRDSLTEELANGTYQLFITNEVGYAISDLVTLTVVPPGKELHSFKAGTGTSALSTPAIGAEDAIYVNQAEGLRCYTADGTVNWTFSVPSPAVGVSPTIGIDGTVFIGSESGRFYAITNGVEKWHFDLAGPIRTEAAIGLDGAIYVGSATPAARLYALNVNGTKRWSFDAQTSVSAAAIDSVGDIYFCSTQAVYAISQSGALKWTRNFANPELSAVFIGAHDLILIPREKDLWALDRAAGTEKWVFPVNAPIHSSVASDGTIYVDGAENLLYAVNPQTGKEQWRASVGNPLSSAPAAAANGYIYVMTWDGVATTKLITLDAAGHEVRSIDLSGANNRTPTRLVLSPNNLLYFGLTAGSGPNLSQSISVQVADAPPADSPWPMWRKTAGNHGNAGGIPGDFRFQKLIYYNPSASAAVDGAGTVWTAFDGQLRGFLGNTNRSSDLQPVDDSPVVGPSGRIFFATLTQYTPPVTTLAIFDPIQNTYVARANVPGFRSDFASMALAQDETLYAGASFETNGTLYSWKEGGDPIAVASFPGVINKPPVITSDGSILVCVTELTREGFGRGTLYKVKPDGVLVGKFSTDETAIENAPGIAAGPVVGGDGSIYINDLSSSIFALTPDLQVKWQISGLDKLGYRLDSSPAIGPDGTLYFAIGANSFSLYAIAPNGALKWDLPVELPGGYGSYSSMAVGDDKTAYIVGGNYLYAVSDLGSHGELSWRTKLPGGSYSSPLLTDDGYLYLSCQGGTFISYKASTGPANSPWPMFRGNAQRTGNAGPPNVPPSIAIIRPTAASSLTDATNVVVEVNTSDDSGPVAKVEYFDGASSVSIVTSPPFSAAIQLAAGTHTLTAKATDRSGATTVSEPVTFLVRSVATFRWAQRTYAAAEGDGTVSLTLEKAGPNPARVNFATRAISAEEGRDFLATSGAVDFGAGVSSQTITIPLLNDFVPDGMRQFEIDLTASSVDSIVITPGIAVVTIADDDAPLEHNSFLEFGFPSDRPTQRGRLQVYLQPPAASGQWRFPWELLWRNSGDIAGDLDPGEYPVEFRPVAGYATPESSQESVPGGITVVRTNDYTLNPAFSGGSLVVLFNPLDLLGGATVPGWRFLGETSYHLNNEPVTNIPPGIQVIEFRFVAGWARPTTRGVLIQSDVETSMTVGYFLSPSPPVGIATPTPFQSYAAIRDGMLSSPRQPSALVGQLRSLAGYGSGFAVRERVILTAAHVLFDDNSLDFVPSIEWFPARQAGEYEPRPLLASGWYVPTNYVTQRRHERIDLGLAPGLSTPASQQWDVGAIYFSEPVARGGFSGYLLSDNEPNEYLISPFLKELFGYPLSGQADGRMHYILPGNYTFTHDSGQIYSTAQFLSYAGNSGGPLNVQFTRTDGQIVYFPAAVYLGNGGNRSIVRAIDSDVASLINLAASSAALGTNFLGEGVIGFNAGAGLGGLQLVHLTVQIAPPSAVTAGAGWRLQGASAYLTNNAKLTLPVGDVHIEFKPVTGYTTPPSRTITLIANQDFTLPVNYAVSTTVGPARFTRIALVGQTLKLRARRVTAGPVIVESSSDLLHWGSLRTIDLAPDVDTDFEIALAPDRAGFLRLRNP